MKRHGVVNVSSKYGAPQRCAVGIHAVQEYLRVNPTAVIRLYTTSKGEGKRHQLVEHAAALGVEVCSRSADELARISGVAEHQGVVAVLREYAYASLDALIERRPSLLVAGDGIEDPRNLGALIRSAAAAGAGGVIIPQDRAAQVTAVVEKSAAGTTAWFPVCRVVNLARTLDLLKRKQGFWIIGLSQLARASLFESKVPLPSVLVVGGETGLRDLVTRSCDMTVRIPMAEGVESLNVAVAAAIVCFELRRRHIDTSGGGW